MYAMFVLHFTIAYLDTSVLVVLSTLIYLLSTEQLANRNCEIVERLYILDHKVSHKHLTQVICLSFCYFSRSILTFTCKIKCKARSRDF